MSKFKTLVRAAGAVTVVVAAARLVRLAPEHWKTAATTRYDAAVTRWKRAHPDRWGQATDPQDDAPARPGEPAE